MDKNIFNMLTSRLLKKWGSNKFLIVSGVTLGSGVVACLTSAAILPNDPEPDMDETKFESVIKTTKSKKKEN